MRSDFREPLNLGQDRMITINQLLDMVARIAGKRITRRHNLSAPQGVRGRNSDNTKLREVLGWEPQISLEAGLERTYRWIEGQLRENPAYAEHFTRRRTEREVPIAASSDRAERKRAPEPAEDESARTIAASA
jgi:dTDP-D-glucose 4,6-dehydratase